MHLLYSSVQFEKIWGKLGPKGLGQVVVYAILYAMYSMKVTLWLRREVSYLSAQASTDRKTGRLSFPFYSIEFFGFSYTPLPNRLGLLFYLCCLNPTPDTTVSMLSKHILNSSAYICIRYTLSAIFHTVSWSIS